MPKSSCGTKSRRLTEKVRSNEARSVSPETDGRKQFMTKRHDSIVQRVRGYRLGDEAHLWKHCATPKVTRYRSRRLSSKHGTAVESPKPVLTLTEPEGDRME